MQLLLTCSECGHQEWGASDRPLMNKIKLWNHASKIHPDMTERIMRLSVPKTPQEFTPQSPVFRPA